MTELAEISVKRISAPSNLPTELHMYLLPYIQTLLLVSESSFFLFWFNTALIPLYFETTHSHMIFLFIPSKHNSFKLESNMVC